ncbi:MAG: hypothetical protein ABJA98_24750 [Acidobacteriota bacterium]
MTVSFRRADIRALWIITTAVFSLAVGLAADTFGAPMPWAWGVAALALPLPGLVWPPWFRLGVRVWNRCAESGAAVLRAYVLKVGYYLLFSGVGRTGSALDLDLRNGETSRWISRARHEQTFAGCNRPSAQGGWWGRELLASAGLRGNAWQVSLLPVMLLLMLLRKEGQESALPSSTYTLY